MKRLILLWIVVLIASKGFGVPLYDFKIWGTYDSTSQYYLSYFYQCHGDADGKASMGRRVDSHDAEIIRAVYFSPFGWPAYYPTSLNYDPRADFDRNFIVNDLDTAILEQWLNKPNVPGDCGKKTAFKQTLPAVLYANATYKIEWDWRIYTSYIPSPDAEDNPKTFSLYYSTDNGQNWIHIATVSNTTNYYWTVPDIEIISCKIRVIDDIHSGLGDELSREIKQCLQKIYGDYNNDCYVNLSDLEILGQNWLDSCSIANNWCENADIEHNETVDFMDFTRFTEDWNKCSDPADSNCVP